MEHSWSPSLLSVEFQVFVSVSCTFPKKKSFLLLNKEFIHVIQVRIIYLFWFPN